MAYRKMEEQGPYAAGGRRIANPMLIQQVLPATPEYPWQMLLACALLNRTHQKQALGALRSILSKWPTCRHVATLNEWDEAELTEILRPLGFGARRRNLVIKMARDFNGGKKYSDCFGVGPYARDSWRIFVEGDIDHEPTDIRLREYVAWARQERKAGRDFRTPFMTRYPLTGSTFLQALCG